MHVWVPRQIGPVHSASWRAPGTGSLWDGQGPSRSLSRLAQGHHAMAHPSTILWKAPRAVELTCVPAFSMGIGSDAPSALVDYLMDLAPRIIEWRSTDCSTSHPQSKTSKRTCHPQFRNGVLEVVRDSKQVTINVRGIFAMRWSNHSEILLVSSE